MRIIGNDPSTPRETQVVASGTLPSGKPVVVNADGTVSVVELSNVSDAVGTAAVFNSGNSASIDAAYDAASGKIVVCYADYTIGGDGTAIVGTVSGTSISFGTPVIFEASNSTIENRIIYDANAEKVVIVFQDNSSGAFGQGKAIVGTVSGTSISFGTKVAITSGQTMENFGIAYDANAQKIAISFRDYTGSNYGACVVGTVSGTSISFGSKTVYNSAVTIRQGMTYDSTAQKIVIAYYDYGATQGNAVVGTISGTSISFGSEATFESNQVDYVNCSYDAAGDRVVVAYQDSGNSNKITAAVGTVSGTSISFGSPVEFDGATNSFIGMAYDPTIEKTIIAYQDDGNSGRGTVVTGTVSGTSISFDTPLVFDDGASGITFISPHLPIVDNKAVISYRDDSDSDNGTSIVFRPAGQEANLTAENYIGMSGGAVSVDSQTEEIGSAVVFESADTTENSVVFDSANNKVVIAYEDRGNSNYGTAVVGTVSGTSISFGTPVVFESAESRNISATFDSSNNKVVIAYDDNGNSSYGTAVVGTVSGTSISFGSPVVFESAGVANIGATFDSSNNKVVIAYEDNGNSNYGTAIVGTVSGTSISFGSPAVFESSQAQRINSTFDSNSNKVVIAYRTTTGKAAVGTVSGTSISFGTPVEFYNATTEVIDIVFDSNVNKVVIAYQSSANDAGLAKVGTVSGTSISFGAEATFNDSNVSAISPAFDSSINKVVIAYEDKGNSDYGTYVVGTVSDTSISFGTSSVFDSVNIAGSMGATFDSANNKVVTAYRDGDNSNYGTSVVLQAGYTNITRGSVADGDNAAINLKGAVAENQVGLTAGQSYYVQTDGTLSTTAGDPSVFAGTAVAATKLIVKG